MSSLKLYLFLFFSGLVARSSLIELLSLSRCIGRAKIDMQRPEARSNFGPFARRPTTVLAFHATVRSWRGPRAGATSRVRFASLCSRLVYSVSLQLVVFLPAQWGLLGSWCLPPGPCTSPCGPCVARRPRRPLRRHRKANRWPRRVSVSLTAGPGGPPPCED